MGTPFLPLYPMDIHPHHFKTSQEYKSGYTLPSQPPNKVFRTEACIRLCGKVCLPLKSVVTDLKLKTVTQLVFFSCDYGVDVE